jgi:hypothetical protein
MTVCAQEVRGAIEAGLARMRAEFPDIGDIREEIQSTIRTEVVTNAVQIRALANTPAKPLAQSRTTSPPSGADFRSTDECLNTGISGRDGKLVNEENLIKAMLDLCRPEIESAARKAFLADSSTTLDQHRANALSSALKRAQTIVVGNQQQ